MNIIKSYLPMQQTDFRKKQSLLNSLIQIKHEANQAFENKQIMRLLTSIFLKHMTLQGEII